MQQSLVNALIAACPQAFRDLGGDPLQTSMARGVVCGDGWFHLLLNLCKALQHELDAHPDPGFFFVQVKEKLGYLRVYTTETRNPRIRQLLDKATAESRTTCELCGANPAAVKNSHGQLQCLCATCEQWAPRAT